MLRSGLVPTGTENILPDLNNAALPPATSEPAASIPETKAPSLLTARINFALSLSAYSSKENKIDKDWKRLDSIPAPIFQRHFNSHTVHNLGVILMEALILNDINMPLSHIMATEIRGVLYLARQIYTEVMLTNQDLLENKDSSTDLILRPSTILNQPFADGSYYSDDGTPATSYRVIKQLLDCIEDGEAVLSNYFPNNAPENELLFQEIWETLLLYLIRPKKFYEVHAENASSDLAVQSSLKKTIHLAITNLKNVAMIMPEFLNFLKEDFSLYDRNQDSSIREVLTLLTVEQNSLKLSDEFSPKTLLDSILLEFDITPARAATFSLPPTIEVTFARARERPAHPLAILNSPPPSHPQDYDGSSVKFRKEAMDNAWSAYERQRDIEINKASATVARNPLLGRPSIRRLSTSAPASPALPSIAGAVSTTTPTHRSAKKTFTSASSSSSSISTLFASPALPKMEGLPSTTTSHPKKPPINTSSSSTSLPNIHNPKKPPGGQST